MRKFLTRLAIYVSVLSVIILAVNICYIIIERKYNPIDIPDNIQICNFGSSHGQRGFNYEDFKGKYICSNFGLTSQSLLYDYRLLQHFKDKLQPEAIVFIPVSYFSFFGKPEVESEEFLSKNKRYYKFLPRKLILQYDWRTDLYSHYLPCLSQVGLTIFIKFVLNIDKKSILWDTNFNLYDEGWNIVTDSRDTEIDAPRAYKRHVANRFDSAGNRLRRQESFEAIYGMIDLCRQLGVRPILVTVPYLREYTDAIRKNDGEFFPDFYGVIEEIRQRTGIEYYDYAFDERFCDDYSIFINSDHLNRKGARKFTNTLLHEVLGIDPD